MNTKFLKIFYVYRTFVRNCLRNILFLEKLLHIFSFRKNFNSLVIKKSPIFYLYIYKKKL